MVSKKEERRRGVGKLAGEGGGGVKGLGERRGQGRWGAHAIIIGPFFPTLVEQALEESSKSRVLRK